MIALVSHFWAPIPSLAAGIVDKAADLDVAMVMGMGFPAYRGGLIFWADLVGAGALGRGVGRWQEDAGRQLNCVLWLAWTSIMTTCMIRI